MTAELRIPIDNEAVLAFWKARASRHAHSVEEEISLALSSAAFKNQTEERFAALKKKVRAACGTLPDSTLLIRQERDA